MSKIDGSSGEFSSGSPIEIRVDDRLTLRQMVPGDSGAYFDLIDSNRVHLSQHGDDTSEKYPTLEDVEARNNDQSPEEYRFGIWVDDSVMVGFAKLCGVGTSVVEVGYWIGEKFTGRGIVTRAVKTLLDYANTELGCDEIIAWVDEKNEKSQEVLRRIGFYEYDSRSNRLVVYGGVTHVDKLFGYDNPNKSTRAKLTEFLLGEVIVPVTFVETIDVKDGVSCDTYRFNQDDTKDLAVVTVSPGHRTPVQRVVGGTRTIEGYFGGAGNLTILTVDATRMVFEFSKGAIREEVAVEVGMQMQWSAADCEQLVFYEVCEPPYVDGRFENLEADVI